MSVCSFWVLFIVASRRLLRQRAKPLVRVFFVVFVFLFALFYFVPQSLSLVGDLLGLWRWPGPYWR